MAHTSAKQTLLVTVGLPRSGKTTWARATGLPCVETDLVRKVLHGVEYMAKLEPVVWLVTEWIIEYMLRQGHSYIIVDATNITKKRREHWQRFATMAAIRFVLFDTAASDCVDRAVVNGEEELVPIIQRMATEYQPLDAQERQQLVSAAQFVAAGEQPVK